MKCKTVWDYMDKKGLTSDDVSENCQSRNDAIEYGWKLGLKSIKNNKKQ